MEKNKILKVSCVIPVYNEGPRVANVVKAALGCRYVDEVIVVNDGSTDSTPEVLQGIPGITLINEPNKGKSAAIMAGFRRASHDLIMMVDSDLVGLTSEALAQLAEPVIKGEADMTISLRQNSLKIYKFLGMDFFSGERVFHKNIIPDLSELGTLPGFIIESYLNQLIVKRRLRIKVVNWPNVITPRKRVKAGFIAGTKSDFNMLGQIVKYLTLRGLVKVSRGMLKQRVN